MARIRSCCICVFALGFILELSIVIFEQLPRPQHFQLTTIVSKRITAHGSGTMAAERTIGDLVNHNSSLKNDISTRINPPLQSDRTFQTGAAQLARYENRSFNSSRLDSSEDLSLSVESAENAKMDGQYIESLERIRRMQVSFSLSTVFPHGGNTLPNYLTRGFDLGILPGSYRDGVILFLHHNKAAGSTIKRCLTELVTRKILKNRSVQVVTSYHLTKMSLDGIIKHNILEGDHIFGLCEHYRGANCSYFTFLRDPYERVLSAYFYCRERQSRDQLCGPIKIQAFTIKQWAIFQGSYFFYQLLMDKIYCEPNEVFTDILRYGLNDSLSFIPPGTSKNLTVEKAHMCWFKQRAYLNTFLNKTGREAILRNVLDNLETWFSVIGLKEEYDLSLKMLSATYDLPFYRDCRDKVFNQTPNKPDSEARERERLKHELMSSPEVVEALKYDVTIYEKAKGIFKRQKVRLDIATKRNQ